MIVIKPSGVKAEKKKKKKKLLRKKPTNHGKNPDVWRNRLGGSG